MLGFSVCFEGCCCFSGNINLRAREGGKGAVYRVWWAIVRAASIDIATMFQRVLSNIGGSYKTMYHIQTIKALKYIQSRDGNDEIY